MLHSPLALHRNEISGQRDTNDKEVDDYLCHQITVSPFWTAGHQPSPQWRSAGKYKMESECRH